MGKRHRGAGHHGGGNRLAGEHGHCAGGGQGGEQAGDGGADVGADGEGENLRQTQHARARQRDDEAGGDGTALHQNREAQADHERDGGVAEKIGIEKRLQLFEHETLQ